MSWAPAPEYLPVQGEGGDNPLAATIGIQTGCIPRAEVIPEFFIGVFQHEM